MYTRIINAHVTAKARTDVFVGHGSIIVTVLSVNEKKNNFNKPFDESNKH